MEIVEIIAVVVVCLLGWVIVSFAAALVLGRMIAKAKSERRAEQAAFTHPPASQPTASQPAAFTQQGVAPGPLAPERASLR